MSRKAKEFRSLSDDDLNKRIAEMKKEMIKARAQASSAPSKNSMQIRTSKRAIARALTIINERKLAKQVSKIKQTPKEETKA